MKKNKNNSKNGKVICLTREFSDLNNFVSGEYILARINQDRQLIPEGAQKTLRDLHPFIEARKYTLATKLAKEHLLEISSSRSLHKYIRKLDYI